MKATTFLCSAIAAFVLLAASQTDAASLRRLSQNGVTDTDILNFALQLECLEAEFYSWAAFGQGLSDADRGNGPASTGGMKASLSPKVQSYAEEIARDEISHVRFLRSALGGAAVACPALNIGTAFAAAANAALNTTLNPAFTPYGSDVVFLHGAFIFEDVGVTAYKGAAPLIQNKDYLGPAAGILGTEAYHAGIIRTLLSQIQDQTVFPYGAPVVSIIEAISNLRDAVGGAGLDQGLIWDAESQSVPNPVTIQTPTPFSNNVAITYVADPSYAYTNLVPTDANGIVFSRTTTEVLAIVYLGSATTPGGFFPQGLNGNIK